MTHSMCHRDTKTSKPVLFSTHLQGQKKTDAGRQNVIIIEDYDGNSEVENQGGEVVTKRFQTQYCCSSSGHSLDDAFCDLTSDFLDSSDEEDCVVIESHQKGPNNSVLVAKKRPRSSTCEVKKKRRSSSDVSDCEIIMDFDGKVRQDWEEAALRRRMASARHKAESEESMSVSDNAANDACISSKGGHVPVHVEKAGKPASDRQHSYGVKPVGHGSAHQERKEAEPPDLDQQGSNVDFSAKGSGDTMEEDTSARDHPGFDSACTHENLQPINSLDNSDQFLDHMQDVRMLGDADKGRHKQPEPDVPLDSVPNIVADRERLKQTEEFQHADEEEWIKRRFELQKQAKEAQRERKRRKLEAKKREEMEARQKQRLEEIRLRQLKEEQTSGFKEQIRGRVQVELEHVAAGCRDMSTLLRRLGVPVDGGIFPTTEQVLAAYKKALLWFHPDRASATAKSDPMHQVEAEEKFKLVSHMKGTLPLISGSHFWCST